uniref:Uncharacterized protein n=1 Tax=Panagrolaimus superbus TaxID=310955 RepID=A0A914XUA3_9BILA
MNIFNGISYAYDGRTILYSPIEIISNEMNFEWIQPHLPQILRDRFPNSDGILKVKIYPTKNFLLSDFSKSLNGLSEDRSWRSVVEVVLSEYAITRENDSYMMMRSGAMFETGEHEFKLGLVWREGNKKGVHIIKEQNVTQMCLAMDYQKIVFFPNNENFLKFLKTFIKNNFGNLNEAEKLCNGLLLSPLNNPRRILCFKEFKNVGHGILPKAVMVKMMDDEIFELNELIINADQKVTIDFLGDKFKEEVLQLNRLPAFRRILLIDEQLRRLQLNNPCTKAFGIFVQEEMLRGSFEILPPMNTVGAMNYQLTPFETGSFQLKPQNYFKKAVLDYVVILASEQDYHRTLKEIQKNFKTYFKKLYAND